MYRSDVLITPGASPEAESISAKCALFWRQGDLNVADAVFAELAELAELAEASPPFRLFGEGAAVGGPEAGAAALILVCRQGRAEDVDRLVALGMCADDVRADFEAFEHACSGGRLGVVDRLIALGIDAADVRHNDYRAMNTACWARRPAIVRRLFELGVGGWDELHFAFVEGCRQGCPEVVDAFVEAGLTANVARADDNKALKVACARGNLAVIDRLLELGLTADDARACHNTALQLACEAGHHAVVRRLLAPAEPAEPAGFGLGAADAQEVVSKYRRGCVVCQTRKGSVVAYAELIAQGAAPTGALLELLVAWGDKHIESARLRQFAVPESEPERESGEPDEPKSWTEASDQVLKVARAVLGRWGGTPELKAAETELWAISNAAEHESPWMCAVAQSAPKWFALKSRAAGWEAAKVDAD